MLKGRHEKPLGRQKDWAHRKKASARRGGMRAEAINGIKYEVPYVAFVPPAAPSIRCIFCSDPVYYYEKTDPLPICLWCEKTIPDRQKGDEELA